MAHSLTTVTDTQSAGVRATHRFQSDKQEYIRLASERLVAGSRVSLAAASDDAVSAGSFYPLLSLSTSLNSQGHNVGAILYDIRRKGLSRTNFALE